MEAGPVDVGAMDPGLVDAIIGAGVEVSKIAAEQAPKAAEAARQHNAAKLEAHRQAATQAHERALARIAAQAAARRPPAVVHAHRRGWGGYAVVGAVVLALSVGALVLAGRGGSEPDRRSE